MSILSAKCDRLREWADMLDGIANVSTPWVHHNLTPMLRDAADTIWQLRNTSLDTANENDELKAENSELRERIGELEELTDGKRYIPQEWYAQLQAENAKLRSELKSVGTAAYLYGRGDLKAENAKLRELCEYLWEFAKTCGADHPLLRELGVEVDA